MSNTLVRDAPNFVIADVRVGLSLDQLVRDAPNFVIPAKSLPSNARGRESSVFFTNAAGSPLSYQNEQRRRHLR